MKTQLALSLFAALTLSPALVASVQADDSIINVKAYFGGKTIDSPAWSEQNGHGTVGVLTDFHTGLYDVRVALDLFGSGSEDRTSSELKGTYTAEAQLGVRKYFSVQSKFSPYVGGGVNFAYASQQNDDGTGLTEVEDMAAGLWLNGGLDLLATDHLTAGVDLRYATAEVELNEQAIELDSVAAGISLGYRW